MTQQVRRGYRSHRKATWAVVALVTVAVAAAVTPLATGAAPKYYTLDAEPASVCYPGEEQQFTLSLTNESQNNTLGSAEVTAPSLITLTPNSLAGAPAGSSIVGNVIKLRNLALTTKGSAVTFTVSATIAAPGSSSWSPVAKQSNDFADTPGPGNLLTLQGGEPPLEVLECSYEYVFVHGPVNAEKGSPQTVKVQLQNTAGQPIDVSDPLTLSAFQGGTTPVDSFFGDLTADPDDSGALAGKQWTFSITGNTAGTGYTLLAGDTTSDPFAIVDGLCNPNVTDTEHVAASCSLTSTFATGPQAGITINNHKLDPIAINFAAGSTVTDGTCEQWNRAKYTVGGETYTFPGVELDFTWGGGMLQVIYRLRNSDWVLTNVSRGNQDIEICAGAKHGIETDLNKDETDGGVPFSGKYGKAKWNASDGLFWGVLSTVQNAGKVREDPAVCARGTQDLATGPNGTLETWRTWTICIPSDWDWKNFG